MSIRISVHADGTLNTYISKQSSGNLCIELALMRDRCHDGGVDIFCTPEQAASILVALAGNEHVRQALKPAQRIYVLSTLSREAVVAS